MLVGKWCFKTIFWVLGALTATELFMVSYAFLVDRELRNGSVGDFPGGPVVKNLPYNAGDAGLIPGQGTKIPHAVG